MQVCPGTQGMFKMAQQGPQLYREQ